ncbi:MAG: ankyrin repeat domain-containing protein [Pseudomonadales bacterium]|nr:ankyrin repeat domain-containing protein [Pseudomonadales bacterium]
MSPESYLVQLFLLYHLSICAGFAVILSVFSRWQKHRLDPVVAYRAHLFALAMGTLLPAVLVFWHASNMAVLDQTTSILNEFRTTTAIAGSEQVTHNPAQQFPVAENQESQESFVLVSNSDDKLQVWDQLSYMLSPLIRYGALIAILGAIIAWLRMVYMLIATGVVVRRSKPIALPQSVVREISVPVLTSEQIQAPMAVGLLRPVILLPANFYQNLDEQQLRHVLMHEHAHHQRKDLWVSLATGIITALFWWSPVVASFKRDVRLYREIVCDQRAAERSHDQLGYAQSLLDCANLIVRPTRALIGHEFIGKENELKSRLTRLINPDHSNQNKKLPITVCCLAFLLLSVSVPNVIADFPQGEQQQRLFRQYRLQDMTTGEAVHSAIDSQDYASLEQLLQSDSRLNTPISGLGTPLMIAINNQDQQMVSYLLEQGADPNQGASRRGNPLILAAARGELATIEQLLAAGADANAIVPRDETPLISAARTGQLAAAALLLENGARPDLGVRTAASDGLQYRTPLNMASTPAMRQLLAKHTAR